MAEYIEREAALNQFEYSSSAIPEKWAQIRIEELPAADVVPVVRCKNCRHRDPEDHKCDSGQLERAGCVFPVDDDYFCAYGECPNCGARMDGDGE